MCSVQGPTTPDGPGLIVHSTSPLFTALSMTVLKRLRLIMLMPVMRMVLPTKGIKLFCFHKASPFATFTPKCSAASFRASTLPTDVSQPSCTPGSAAGRTMRTASLPQGNTAATNARRNIRYLLSTSFYASCF